MSLEESGAGFQTGLSSGLSWTWCNKTAWGGGARGYRGKGDAAPVSSCIFMWSLEALGSGSRPHEFGKASVRLCVGKRMVGDRFVERP